MPLLTLADAQPAYGLSPLLDGAALTVQDNERIGLIGRNGTGKSSLLGVIAGAVTLDGGELRRQEGNVPLILGLPLPVCICVYLWLYWFCHSGIEQHKSRDRLFLGLIRIYLRLSAANSPLHFPHSSAAQGRLFVLNLPCASVWVRG
jgi:energy-coupling factor transporter ATP-binding protein EcfA2